MNERHWEEASLGGVAQQVALHPVFVLCLFVDDDDEVALFEGQLVVVVGLAVVQGPTPPLSVSLEFKKNIFLDFDFWGVVPYKIISGQDLKSI